nr:hypothetical protein [Tanacetum cinerariifolium]
MEILPEPTSNKLCGRQFREALSYMMPIEVPLSTYILLILFESITTVMTTGFTKEAEVIHLILTRIGDDIYSTVDACTTAKDMWITVESLRTSSNTRNKNVDTFPRHKNDNQTRQFGNQRTVTVARARETIGNQAEKGVPLCAEQTDWLDDTDEELDEQELEAHYSFMAKIHEVITTKSRPTFNAEPLKHVQSNDDYNVFANERQYSNTYVVEKVDSDVIPDSSNMCDNEGKADQNAEECDDECALLANLIANLKLDTDEKKIQKQLKKENTSLAQELKE